MYQQLPVYTEFRNGRTRVLTRISKIDGDVVVSCIIVNVEFGTYFHRV